MRKITKAALATLVAAIVGCGGPSETHMTQAEFDKKYTDDGATALLGCQTEKIEDDLGVREGRKYMSESFREALASQEGSVGLC